MKAPKGIRRIAKAISAINTVLLEIYKMLWLIAGIAAFLH
jgi:hypothetical protein